MRIQYPVILATLLILLLVGCSEQSTVAPLAPTGDSGIGDGTVDLERAAGEIALISGWEFDPEVEIPDGAIGIDAKSLNCVIDFSREEVAGGVAHYSYTVRIGPGPYDVIGLHRVVKERRPYRPVRTRRSVFLLHGDPGTFAGVYLLAGAAAIPSPESFACFLAERNVDVWGIDQSWSLVPAETADFSFMADWGVEHDVDNSRMGLGMARLVRLLTGNGFDRMNLLGYSSGAITDYALLDRETQLPSWQRHAKGFVCVDMVFKSDLADVRNAFCDLGVGVEDLLAAGTYEDMSGVLFAMLGELAQVDPDGESPIIPGFTNMQAALFFGGATWEIIPFTSWFHMVGAVFGEEGLPYDLEYTSVEHYLSFVQGLGAYVPNRFIADYYALVCDEVDVSFDDHFAEITVPVMYLGAAGGLGATGLYSTTLVGSTDITTRVIEFQAPENITLDFGHIDIFAADDAPQVAWQPIFDWIADHAGRADTHPHRDPGSCN